MSSSMIVNSKMMPFSTAISSAIGSAAAGPKTASAMGRAMKTVLPNEAAMPWA